MILVYMSMTGFVTEFIRKVNKKSMELTPSNTFTEMNEDYIVVLPSYEGELNDEIMDFIDYKDNESHLVGFASSGNINFGGEALYCINGRQLSEIYDKPLIHKFEFEGTEEDVSYFRKEVERLEITSIGK